MHSNTIFTLATAAVFALPADAQAQTILSSGHLDLEIAYEGGLWSPHWHSHDTDAEMELGQTIVQGIFDSTDAVNQSDYPFARPSGSSWDFTGVATGETLYAFPTFDSGSELPYLGNAAEEIAGGVFLNNKVYMQFKGLQSGPTGGDFSLYRFTGGGPTAIFSSFDQGLTNAANTMELNTGSHNHYNWAFTEVGTYDLLFEAFGTLAVDGMTEIRSGDFTITMQIVPEPGTLSLLALPMLLLRRHRRA